MELEQKYNQRNPAVKRLMREACELQEPTEEYFACPLEENLFEWHFTVHGSPETDYSGGVYHGRILLPPEYPMKPPNIILLTVKRFNLLQPNGRFEVNKKICLNISEYHPETWQPSWSIRTALLALIAFMSSPGRGSIGALEYTPEERRILAQKSRTWKCEQCGPIIKLLNPDAPKPATQDERELLRRIDLKAEDTEKKGEETAVTEPAPVSKEEPDSVPNSNSSDSPPLSPSQTISPPSPPPQIQVPVMARSSNSLGRFGDIMIVVLVVFVALLIARRLAVSVLF